MATEGKDQVQAPPASSVLYWEPQLGTVMMTSVQPGLLQLHNQLFTVFVSWDRRLPAPFPKITGFPELECIHVEYLQGKGL
jgi:hypothetical protein